MYAGFVPDNNVPVALHSPMGAPLLTRWEGMLQDGRSVYHMARGWREECRVFVDGQQEGAFSCRIHSRSTHGYTDRLWVKGLKNATVRFFPVPGSEDNVAFQPDPTKPFYFGNLYPARLCKDAWGTYFELENISGHLMICW